jgi:hypothetical protein
VLSIYEIGCSLLASAVTAKDLLVTDRKHAARGAL